MHKIRLEGDHQTLTFGVTQLVDAMQPGGAKVNISWGFWVKGALFRFFEAFGVSGCVVCAMWCDVGGS